MKNKYNFFLVYSCLPVISPSIYEVKKEYQTNNIIQINYQTFLLIINEFELYTKKIKTLLKTI